LEAISIFDSSISNLPDSEVKVTYTSRQIPKELEL